MSRLEHWSIIVRRGDPYQSPEQASGCLCLQGFIYEDERFSDGLPITTTLIREIKDGGVVTKSGTFYELGKVLPEYEEQFPNARKRLLSQEEEELKPCPFCGGKAECDYFGGYCVYIICRTCGAKTNTQYVDSKEVGVLNATSAWNTRAGSEGKG